MPWPPLSGSWWSRPFAICWWGARRAGRGLGLARSLARQGGVFSALYCALVEAGERSGRLAQVLERLADHLEQVQRQHTRRVPR
ncbi:type II secretion system F family protein [Pseudomonas qingdaonensis]|nr:type II secretion system F family protein [Pseudomonas qingdaonensis]